MPTDETTAIEEAERLYYRAAALVNQEKRQEAVPLLRKALAVHERHAWAHCTLGVILAEDGQAEEGEEHLRRAVTETNQQDPVILNNLAAFLRNQRRFEEARATYERVLALRETGIYRWAYADVLEHLGRFEEALESYKLALLRPWKPGSQLEFDEWVPEAHEGIARCVLAVSKEGEQEKAE